MVSLTVSCTLHSLNKSPYDLKQSPLCWFNALQDRLISLGFHSCPVESALFYRDFSPPPSSPLPLVRCWVVVYVDDLLLACAAKQVVLDVYNGLSSQFLLKRIDHVDNYLGLQIVFNPSSLSLFFHQQRYLAMPPLQHALDRLTPLSPSTSARILTHPLQLLIALPTCARSARCPIPQWAPDLTSPFHTVGSAPEFSSAHFNSIRCPKRNLRYVCDTQSFGLLYQGGEEDLVLRGYCNAGVPLCQWCTTGWVLTFGGAAVS